MKEKKYPIREIAYGAIFVILMSVFGGVIKVIAPFLPFSLQPIVAVFAGFILKPKTALISQITYVALGLIGLPVFTGGGGLGYIFYPTFGYLLGFIICSYVISLIWNKKDKKNTKISIIATIIGVVIIYVVGIPYMYVITKFYTGNADFSLLAAITGNGIYFAKDIIIALALSPTMKFIHKAVKK